jgi:hypothetical protein
VSAIVYLCISTVCTPLVTYVPPHLTLEFSHHEFFPLNNKLFFIMEKQSVSYKIGAKFFKYDTLILIFMQVSFIIFPTSLMYIIKEVLLVTRNSVYTVTCLCVSCCISVLLLCAGYPSVPSDFGAVSQGPVKTGVYWSDKRDRVVRQNGGLVSLFLTTHTACLVLSCHAFIVSFC